MSKSKKTAETGAPIPPEATAETEVTVAEKPRRGRKPKSAKKPEDVASEAPAQESDIAKETADGCQTAKEQESESVQETAEESGTSTETTTAMEPTSEAGKEAVAEAEPTPGPVDGGEEETPPETVPEDGTKAQTATVEEPATTQENVSKEAAEDGAGAGNPAEETEPEKADEKERTATPVPLPTTSAQIVESPLKRMKREFNERSQIIKEQMRNIQNSFIMIGFQLFWIRENKMFRVLNYKNIYEYAEKEYGIKRTTCGNFICIIENYAERDANGEVIESIAECYRNYSASQLVAMLGMPEELKQQVTPDMTVRAITKLRKGEEETPKTVEAAPAPKEEPVKEAPAPAKETEEEKTAVTEDTSPDHGTEDGPETVVEQEAEVPAEESKESPISDTISVETSTTVETAEEEQESTELTEPETDEDAADQPEERHHADGDTLAEIDSYNDYQSMADELDLIMRHVFASDSSVRVKIVCVQG